MTDSFQSSTRCTENDLLPHVSAFQRLALSRLTMELGELYSKFVVAEKNHDEASRAYHNDKSNLVLTTTYLQTLDDRNQIARQINAIRQPWVSDYARLRSVRYRSAEVAYEKLLAKVRDRFAPQMD